MINNSVKSTINNPLIDYLIKNSHEAFIALDNYHRIIFFNPIAEKLFNFHSSEAIGLSIAAFCKRTSWNFKIKKQTLLYKRKTISLIVPYEKLKLTWLIDSLNINDENLIILTTTDFGEKEKVNELIRLETLIENMPSNVYWVDQECKMLGCNQNVLSMLNISREEYLGKTYEELSNICNWPPGLAAKLKNDDMYVLRHKKPIFGIEDPPIPAPNNKFFNFLTSRVPIRNNTGDIIAVAGISMDISNLKAAKEKAVKASQVKTEFIANMSHDIRTPLTGIIGMSQLLENDIQAPEEKQKARWLYESGEQLLELCNGILEVVSADNVTELDINLECFDLRQTLQAIIQLELPTIKLKNLNLKRTFRGINKGIRD